MGSLGWTLILAAAVSAVSTTCLAQQQPMDTPAATSQPSPADVGKSPEELQEQFIITTRQLQEILPPAVLSNPDRRAEFAPRAIPILYHRLQLIDQLAAYKLLTPINQVRSRSVAQSMLYLLEDEATVRRVNNMLASNEPSRKFAGQLISVNADWIGAGNVEDKQSKVTDEVEKLAKANPAEIRLTQLTMAMADAASSVEIERRLLVLVADVMTDPVARTQKVGVRAQIIAIDRLQQHVGQPITFTGKTIDGNDFNSANWKGKVVIVDFWATWCNPCRAELPHVVEMFNAYHSKGLEIVGVSSDTAANQLQEFLNSNTLPWPQLFDPQTATTKLHPLCAKYDIAGIPAIFIIDKQGVLRSAFGWRQMDALVPKLLDETK